MKGHYVIKFVDMKIPRTSDQTFRVPQCECGRLASRHYEIYLAQESKKSPYMAHVVCVRCFNRWIRIHIDRDYLIRKLLCNEKTK
jgi:hypothetical protein